MTFCWGRRYAERERGPAIGAVKEFVAESELQLGVTGKVADGADVEAGGDVFAHAQGVGVVETEWAGHGHAVFCQRVAELFVGGGLFGGEDFAGEGSGVFGIGVDLAVDQGVPDEACPAELAAVGGIDAVGLEALVGDFAEDHRFGEGFGSDGDVVEGLGAGGDREGDEKWRNSV